MLTMGVEPSYQGVHMINTGTPINMRYSWGMPNWRPQNIGMYSFQPFNGFSGHNSITSQSRNQIKQGNAYQHGSNQLQNLGRNLDNETVNNDLKQYLNILKTTNGSQ